MRNWYENIIKFPALKDKRSETANRFRRIEAVADELDDIIAELNYIEMDMDHNEMMLGEKKLMPNSLTKFTHKSLTATALELENASINFRERLQAMLDAWAETMERKLGGDK
tara:strand:+ start:458 stop:793 length:336 start_codon:yes stop_codon:yes gene_type:complete